jgi:hypothetical protein
MPLAAGPFPSFSFPSASAPSPFSVTKKMAPPKSKGKAKHARATETRASEKQPGEPGSMDTRCQACAGHSGPCNKHHSDSQNQYYPYPNLNNLSLNPTGSCPDLPTLQKQRSVRKNLLFPSGHLLVQIIRIFKHRGTNMFSVDH